MFTELKSYNSEIFYSNLSAKEELKFLDLLTTLMKILLMVTALYSFVVFCLVIN